MHFIVSRRQTPLFNESQRQNRTPRISLLLITTCCIFAVGCNSADSGAGGSGGRGNTKDDLLQLGQAYLNYHDVNGAGPADWNELEAFVSNDSKTVGAFQRLRDAGYAVKWSVRMRDVTDGIGTYVLAESPQGGPKLMLDGLISE